MGKSFEDTLSELIASRIQELNEAGFPAPPADEKEPIPLRRFKIFLESAE